jgi:glycerate-2-kinase
MKKYKRNATFRTPDQEHNPLAIRRETVRALTGDDLALALVAGGSSTILTERTNSVC